jgi:putative MATE family efflux protein
VTDVMNSSVNGGPPSGRGGGVWSAIAEGLRGAHGRDFTEGPVGRAVVVLAVPMVLEMVMESVFAVVDVFVVARLGADAVAAVGLTESLMTILYTLAMGLGIGTGAMVARRIGEKDAEGAARTAAQALGFGLLVAAAAGAAGFAYAPRLLALMGAPPGALAHAPFARVLLGGSASVVLLFLANSVARAAGDAANAMRALWLANGINVVLCPALVFGWGPLPALGTVGAALGTTAGRAAGALWAAYMLTRPASRARLRPAHFRPDAALIGRLLRLSGPATFQVFVGMASWVGLVRIMAGFGSEALAGYTIGMRIVLFALLPSFGMSNAAATMVGQALGAKKPERAEAAVWKAGLYNVAFLGTVGLALVALAPRVVAPFAPTPAVAAHASSALRIVASGFVFYAYGMVLTQSFNGAGDTRTPTWINLGCFWLLELPLAWLLARALGLGPNGVFFALLAAFSSLAVVSAVLFRRGAWKAAAV